MVLDNELDAMRYYNDARLDIWVGDKQNCINNLTKCKSLLSNIQDSGLQALHTHAEEMLKAWGIIDVNKLGVTKRDIVSSVHFSCILLPTGQNTAEFRGRFHGSQSSIRELLTVGSNRKINQERRIITWVAVNQIQQFTANLCFSFPSKLAFGNVIYHTQKQFSLENEIRNQEQYSFLDFFIRDLMEKL